MMQEHKLAKLKNGQALALELIPNLAFAEFEQAILLAVAKHERVVALFGCPAEGALRLHVVLADDEENSLYTAYTVIEGTQFPSLTLRCPQVHLFEREIAEQFGVTPLGHPWFKPVRYHHSTTSLDAWNRNADLPIMPAVGDFYRVEGEDVHEVAVGPVHAGIIEPGHFRFQCHGETVFHLEIALGFQHRGVEQALIGGPNKRTLHYAETVSGDATIAHCTSHCQVIEALAKSPASARAQALRGIALELERLANHVGDIGALAGDVGFLPTSSYCGRIRGDFLNMTAVLCGSRFGRGFVVPGGIHFDVDKARIVDLLARLEAANKDTEVAVKLLWDSQSVVSRFEDTGPLPRNIAVDLGMVGPVARASGLNRDVRRNHPVGIFRFSHIPVATYDTGDVFARAYVRWLEVKQSVEFIREQLMDLPAGARVVPVASLAKNTLAIALNEGWRGEVCHIAITDAEGRFDRYKIVDPSFHNWAGLAYVLRNQEISDFPICNKSFSLSYCGHDL